MLFRMGRHRWQLAAVGHVSAVLRYAVPLREKHGVSAEKDAARTWRKKSDVDRQKAGSRPPDAERIRKDSPSAGQRRMPLWVDWKRASRCGKQPAAVRDAVRLLSVVLLQLQKRSRQDGHY